MATMATGMEETASERWCQALARTAEEPQERAAEDGSQHAREEADEDRPVILRRRDVGHQEPHGDQFRKEEPVEDLLKERQLLRR